MSNIKKRSILFIPILIIIVLIALRFWAQQCTEYSGVFTENFDTTDYKDAVHTSVANWPAGPIQLSNLGANFSVTEPSGMGAKIYVCDAGDFDGDGYPDLIGLDITSDPNNRLILIRNYYEDANQDGYDDDGIIFRIDPTEVYEAGTHLDVGPASITAGDYNNDGLLDFFFYKNQQDEFGYTQFLAAMYINVGTETDPHFYPHSVPPSLDFTSAFMNVRIYCNWAADHLCSADIDNDGDTDILVISQDRIFLIRNPGTFDEVSDFEIRELNYDARTGFTIGRGGSSIDTADFDNDGDIDIIGGTVNDIEYLVFYENDGTGFFTRREIPIPVPECSGTVATCPADFNNDGWIDIFAATDRWNAGNEARMWFMKNRTVSPVDFDFRCLNNCDPILPPPHDVDMSAYLDYDQDGDYDVILADANHSGDYYLIINELAPVYTLTGEARSLNVTPELDPNMYSITRVRLTNLQQGTKGGSSEGLSVTYYVSNNDGRDWEFYQRFEGNQIRNYSQLPWHTFNHYGSRLRWRVVFDAAEDEMEEYEDASFETPLVHQLSLEYVYVERREYSRSSVVVTRVEEGGGQQIKLVISGTFYFPGWQGHLRAYDVTNMMPEVSPYSVLRTVSRMDLSSPSGREMVASGVNIRWDAGELLNSRPASERTIYTALPSGSSLMRVDFTTSNVNLLGPILQDVNGDNAGLINFVRGEGRYWKLGDIDHSNPIVVGAPGGSAPLMGPGYDTFAQTWANRKKVVYVGANDGMIHCFDVLTGEELWGFIPYNLLPKLKNMWAVDSSTGTRYFSRDIYVDGSPVAADAYIDADGNGSKEWRTVLICGQGPGKGSAIGGGLNYYFALDVTNPDEPLPLWEFTTNTMGETWSKPAVGKINKEGQDTWVAFMGSGYDNDPNNVVGNWFYVLDMEEGRSFFSFMAPEIDTSGVFPNIPNAIPGSPSTIDINSDGFTDRVYVGDLEGRMWRLDTSSTFTVRGRGRTTWDNAYSTIYEDSNNYPIVCKPAVWLNPGVTTTVPRVYFGTGGDDHAPANATYSFIALQDGQNPEIEWYVGDSTILNLPQEKDVGDLSAGEKVWADPQVANYIVYFSTLSGNIESVDPCENLQGLGRLYARFIIALAGTPIGSSAFRSASGPLESLGLESKTRSAVTLGEREVTSGGERKREVYIQEYDSALQKLEQPVGATLKVKSWREVYRIIK